MSSTQVILWHYPDTGRVPTVLTTQHRANIFGVQILPCTGNTKVVTGAMDNMVHLLEMDASPSSHLASPASSQRISDAGGGGGQGSRRGRGGLPRRHRWSAPAGEEEEIGLEVVHPNVRLFECHTSRVKVGAVRNWLVSVCDGAVFVSPCAEQLTCHRAA